VRREFAGRLGSPTFSQTLVMIHAFSRPATIAGVTLITTLGIGAFECNTAGDAFVFLPDERILLTGDLVTMPCPFQARRTSPTGAVRATRRPLAAGLTWSRQGVRALGV